MIGSDSRGVAEAIFIRSYTADVTLIAPDKALRLRPEDSQKLKDAGIECVDGPAQAVAIDSNCIVVDTAEGHYAFDSIYPALGSDTHTQLAEMVGAELSKDDCVRVDSHQRTSVPGFYAAGDVVIGLDQISHAMDCLNVAEQLIGQASGSGLQRRNGIEHSRKDDRLHHFGGGSLHFPLPAGW